MNTNEILKLLSKNDVKNQLQGIEEADRSINTELYFAVKALSSDYKSNEMVKMAAQKVVKKYDPDILKKSNNNNDDDDNTESSSEIKFGDDSNDGMSTKISDYDSDSEKKLLKIVLSVSLGIIFITTIVCALLFYKPWSLLNKAEKAFKARKWVIAISEYNATIDYNTRSSSFIIENKLEKIYFDLIEACVQKQDDTALVDACFKLIDQFPDNYDYAFKVADILEKNELTADALEIYEIIKKRGDDKAISIAEKHCSRLSSETFGENTNENDEDEEDFNHSF